jgi:hypothetical protein
LSCRSWLLSSWPGATPRDIAHCRMPLDDFTRVVQNSEHIYFGSEIRCFDGVDKTHERVTEFAKESSLILKPSIPGMAPARQLIAAASTTVPMTTSQIISCRSKVCSNQDFSLRRKPGATFRSPPVADPGCMNRGAHAQGPCLARATVARSRSPPYRPCGCRTGSRRAARASREQRLQRYIAEPSPQGRARPGDRTDKSDTGRSRVAERHWRTRRGFLPPLTARRVVSAWWLPAVVHICSGGSAPTTLFSEPTVALSAVG